MTNGHRSSTHDTNCVTKSGHRLVALANAVQPRDRRARLAHVRLQLRIGGAPRVDDEGVVGGRFVASAETLEDTGPLHGPNDVVEAVAA